MLNEINWCQGYWSLCILLMLSCWDTCGLKPSRILRKGLNCPAPKLACLSLTKDLLEVPEGRKESAGGPWQFMGLLPLFDPPRHDSAETIRRALNLGVNVKMITGD